MENETILGGGYTCSVCGQYQRTSALCHHDDRLIPKDMDDKELIIRTIAERIREEQKKHEHSIPDWHEIAARKIYATFNVLSLIEEYREKELPNRNKPYHYEAEISSGLDHLVNYIKNKQE